MENFKVSDCVESIGHGPEILSLEYLSHWLSVAGCHVECDTGGFKSLT